MHSIQALLPPNNHKIAVQFAIGALLARNHSIIVRDHELLASEAKVHCQALNDPGIENNRGDEGVQCLERALEVAQHTGDIKAQCLILHSFALFNWRMGKFTISQALADEVFRLGQLCGSCYHQAQALWVNVLCDQILGSFKNCISVLQRTRELLGLCGMSWGIVDFQLRVDMATTHEIKSEYAQVLNLFTQLASEMSVEREQAAFAMILINIAEIGVVTGASKQDVLQNLDMAKMIFNTLEDFLRIYHYKEKLAGLELGKGELLAVAKNRFEKCLKWSWTRHTEILFNCLEKMADISCWGPANFNWAATFGIFYLAFRKETEVETAQSTLQSR
ncbi:hypothetical protein C8R45DRAFT_936059 [Mycena sanguinolenta]|nr:hypothetical protein C8R45DRAFT_936059 [Mycena sanguinolenta]